MIFFSRLYYTNKCLSCGSACRVTFETIPQIKYTHTLKQTKVYVCARVQNKDIFVCVYNTVYTHTREWRKAGKNTFIHINMYICIL